MYTWYTRKKVLIHTTSLLARNVVACFLDAVTDYILINTCIWLYQCWCTTGSGGVIVLHAVHSFLLATAAWCAQL